jgi:hypothetical protein
MRQGPAAADSLPQRSALSPVAAIPRERFFFQASLALLLFAFAMHGAARIGAAAEKRARPAGREILPERDWAAIEQAVDQGLVFLARQQKPDGSFNGTPENEPGITGLCVLAFLARGHVPGQGPFGSPLEKAVDSIIASQQPSGLLARAQRRTHAPYCHGIGSLALSEIYGMGRATDEAKLRRTIEQSLVFAGKRLSQPKYSPDDHGSWRYLTRHGISDGDLSVTSWHIMFLRSARNAGFEVDVGLIDEAIAYIHRLHDPGRKTFRYEIHTDDPEYNHTRGMAGAGVLALALAGEHQSAHAKDAARYILDHPFDQYDHPINGEQYPCYAAFYCSQGMFQIGGESWKTFYPQLARTLVRAQRASGAWRNHSGRDVQYGEPYMTALSILALSPPFQMLPIFQK